MDCTDFNNNRPALIFDNCPSSNCFQLIFKENNILEWNIHPSRSTYREFIGTYSISGNMITLCIDGGINCFDYQAEVVESELTITSINITSGCIPVHDLIKI